MCTRASREQLFATPRTAASQAPPSVGFPRRGRWSGLPFPPPGDLPDSRIEPESPAWQTGSLPLSRSPGKPRLPGKGGLAVSRWPGVASGASLPGAENRAEPSPHPRPAAGVDSRPKSSVRKGRSRQPGTRETRPRAWVPGGSPPRPGAPKGSPHGWPLSPELGPKVCVMLSLAHLARWGPSHQEPCPHPQRSPLSPVDGAA